MLEQNKKETRRGRSAGNEGNETKANPEIAQKGEKVKKDIDEILDEIDEVLEENAEEFVKNYVQRGGE